MRALILAIAMALSAGAAHAESAVKHDAALADTAQRTLATAYQQAQAGDSAGVVATLTPLVHAADFSHLPEQQRFIANVLLAGGLSDLNRGAEALPLLQQATTFSGADGDVWRLRLWAGYEAQDFADVATSMETLGQRFPEILNDTSSKSFFYLIYAMRDAPDRDALTLRVLLVLHDHWRSANPFVRTIQLDELTRLLIADGQVERARQIAGEIDDPDIIVRWMVDRRFDAVLPNPPDAARLRALYEADLARKRQASSANPDLLEGVNDVIGALVSLNRGEEALTLANAAITRSQNVTDPRGHFTDQDDNLNWTYDSRSRALRALGRYDDSIAEMRAGALRVENGGYNVSQLINLGEALIAGGKNDEAVSALAHLDEGHVSKYGWMNAQFVRACAHHRAGQEADAQTVLAAMRARAEDSRLVMIYTELCFGNVEQAAHLYLAELNDPEERVSALLGAQTYIAPQARGPYDRETDAQWAAMIARPEVQAAVAQYGRIIEVPTLRGPF